MTELSDPTAWDPRAYTRAAMTPQLRRLVLSVAAVLGMLLMRRRPIRRPEETGDWHPADH